MDSQLERIINSYSQLSNQPHQKPRGLRLHSLRLFVPGASNGPRFMLDCAVFMFKFLTLYYAMGSSNIGMKPLLVYCTYSYGHEHTAVMGGRLITAGRYMLCKFAKYFHRECKLFVDISR